jgi:hypothetical protein
MYRERETCLHALHIPDIALSLHQLLGTGRPFEALELKFEGGGVLCFGFLCSFFKELGVVCVYVWVCGGGGG